MRQTHVGGEKVFVDFAGDMIEVIDPESGEVQAMKLFVAAMGASNYTYAEAKGWRTGSGRMCGYSPSLVACPRWSCPTI